MISVGKGGEGDPFMETTFTKNHNILYAAFAGWNDNTNEWKINIPEEKKLSLTTKGYNYQYHPFFCFLSVKAPTTTTVTPTTTKGPVNGNWGSWSSWGSCNTATGTKTRSRSCNNPAPENGGSSCPGSSSSTDKCEISF